MQPSYSEYYREMEEHKVANKVVRTDEHKAGPILRILFFLICMWAMNVGVLLYRCSVLQCGIWYLG